MVWLIPAFPLLGFLLILLFGRRLGDPRAGLPRHGDARRVVRRAVGVFFDLLGRPAEERSEVVTLFTWLPVGELHVDLAFLADPLSITMCLFVTGIGALIHLYAIGYMHGDPKFSKFFLYLNLFAFSMLMLVLGENLLVTFLGWEGVGTCSYFLISFWHTRESAATAGKKAFVTNRVGDFGFMLAMFLAFQALGSLSYTVINHAAEQGGLARVDGDGHRRPAVRRGHRQERPAPAVLLAARRDGGPDAGVGADPRRHHGDRRRLPDGPHEPGAHRVGRLGADDDRLDRGDHGAVRGDDRRGPERHQEGARLLDGQPARLHVPRRRLGRLRRRHLPHDHPRLLQGAAVPRVRLGHPRHARASRTCAAWARCAS